MQQQAILLAGLGFGDEGKGTMIDYLARKHNAHTVVRYNGGAQAAHNVVTPDGKHHTFAQFGSATFVPHVKTYLSRFMVVEPAALLNEGRHLQQLGVTDACARLTIDEQAPIITPFQIAAGRLKEASRGAGRHGSCGFGVGETWQDFLTHGDKVLLAGDLKNPWVAKNKLQFLRELKIASLEGIWNNLPNTEAVTKAKALLEHASVIDRCLDIHRSLAESVSIAQDNYISTLAKQSGTLLFEGAQGILLDGQYGFHPYKTKTDITFNNAFQLLREAEYEGEVKRLGVVRSYATRHGAGPFVTEDRTLGSVLLEPHNTYGQWQGGFRIGYFDAAAIRYALQVIGGVDEIALTHADQIQKLPQVQICTGYAPTSDGRYFEYVNDIARNIKVQNPTTDIYQTALTEQLFKASPVYNQLKIQGGITVYLQFLEQELQTPITTVSFGPTAEDKCQTVTLGLSGLGSRSSRQY